MQKRIIRIMTGCNSRVCCRNLFRRLEILRLVSQYILSLMLFVVTKKIFLFWIQSIILKVQDNSVIFISPKLILLYTKGQYITWALRSSVIFLHTLKMYLIMLGYLILFMIPTYTLCLLHKRIIYHKLIMCH